MLLRLLAEPLNLSPAFPLRIETVRRSAGEAAPARFYHFHAAAELVLFEAASGAFVTDSHQAEIGPRTVAWTPPMVFHDFVIKRGAAQWTLIQFEAGFVSAPLEGEAVAVAHDGASWTRLQVLTRWLGEALARGEAEEARRILGLLLHISTRGSRLLGEPMAGAGLGGRFRPLLDELRSDGWANLDLTAAASLCHLSPAHFSRAFKAAFGTGFSAYMNRLRLDHAAIVVASTDEPINAIGYRFGFHSPAYFAAQFRRRFGAPPSVFRDDVRSAR